MRDLFTGLMLFISFNLLSQTLPLGEWGTDEAGLPNFSYKGSLPYSTQLADGIQVKLPEDPWFLLGNYRFTLFTHVSGQYQMITGQRGWGRINQGNKPNSGQNSATVKIGKNQSKVYDLVGINSHASNPNVCKRTFGCGYAEYKYNFKELNCIRNISVKPSSTPYNGISAFLLTVTIENKTNKPLEFQYSERMLVNYEAIQQQRTIKEQKLVKYIHEIDELSDGNTIVVNIRGHTEDPFMFPDRDDMSRYDGYPPSVFMSNIEPKVHSSLDQNETDSGYDLESVVSYKLKPRESVTFKMAVGYTFEGREKVDAIVSELTKDMKGDNGHSNKFANYWMKVVPSPDTEKDAVFKREMVWNAYNLEAMATYSEYYKESYIPQGTIYDYDWGRSASSRDHAQHALALIYYNPELAKSVIKFLMKKTTPAGEIMLEEVGNGFCQSWSYFTSDQQLFFFMLFAEYLRVTGDYSILTEDSYFYPFRNMKKITTLDNIEACFRFLRDFVSVGEHGLVRLLNSDWNDAVYFVIKEPYNRVFHTGESHMNTTMAITIFENLTEQLKIAGAEIESPEYKERLDLLIKSMALYRTKLVDAFLKDNGDRIYSRRMYFAGKAYGEENMFLEPQGYMLQMSELNVKKKRLLYDELKKRVYSGEKIAARQQQSPVFEDESFDKGSRENGGVWYSLNGPVIIGISTFDKDEAWKLLKKMSFDNFAKKFPQYWSSYWSQSDNFESSLIPTEGLPDQTWNYSDIPVYCAHAHAWPLYCYFKLLDKN